MGAGRTSSRLRRRRRRSPRPAPRFAGARRTGPARAAVAPRETPARGSDPAGLRLGADAAGPVSRCCSIARGGDGDWQGLLDAGVYTNLMVPPATPAGLSIVRISLSAAHSDEDLVADHRLAGRAGQAARSPRARARGCNARLSASAAQPSSTSLTLSREAGRDLAVAAEVGMDLVDPVVAVAAFGRVGAHQGVAGVDDVECRQRLATLALAESSAKMASARPSVSRSAMRCCSEISMPEPAKALNSHGPAIAHRADEAGRASRGVA